MAMTGKLTEEQEEAKRKWEDVRKHAKSTPAEVEKTNKWWQGGVADVLKVRGGIGDCAGACGGVDFVCEARFRDLADAFAGAIGQMALTNYLTHSVVCSTIFRGHGVGMFGRLQRYELYYVVAGLWVFQMIMSPIWLRHFNFGPAEWGWREKQSMRKVRG